VTRNKRVLAVHYSQSGQLASVMRQVLAPLVADSVEVTEVALDPLPAFPYPWPVLDFIDAMPETVQLDPPPLAPLPLHGDESFDLVILGYPVWFLSPAPPMTAFMQSPLAARLLAGRPVVTLTACRNMWLMAHDTMRGLVQRCGGRLLDHIALTDPGPTLATFITTPRWLLTGRRDAFFGMPPAGLAPQQVADSARFGRALATALRNDAERANAPLLDRCNPCQVDLRLIDAERIGRRSFGLWSRLLRTLGPPGGGVRQAGVLLFAAYLVSAIVVVVPITMVLRALLAPLRRARLAREVAYFASPAQPPARR
jgi:hypothetical protein